MTLRNVGRNRRRSAYTAGGVVLALTLVLVAWGMIDTIDVLLQRQFDQMQTYDAGLRLTVPVDDAAVTAVDGVARAEPVVDTVVVVSPRERSGRG